MSRKRSVVSFAVALAAAGAVITSGAPGTAGPLPDVAAAQPGPTYVYKVHAPLGEQSRNLLGGGFDVLEQRDGDSLFVLGGKDEGARLQEAGFTAVVDQVLAPPQWTPPAGKSQVDAADINETFYGGYHTVNAHYSHLDAVAAQFPGLTALVDYGDLWKKTQGAGGYDLRAICITKLNDGDCALDPNAPKPRFFVMGQLHARELTTGDVAWRWIDHLTSSYGTDAGVTALLDSTEVWVVPQANPDGINIVQQGGNSPIYQRKNANGTNGSNCGGTSSSQLGIDLNRNTSSHWGGQGTSSSPCDQTYKGPSANSEVETQALQALWRNLYKDKRGTAPSDAAPADTTGVVVSMHSYANLILFPWGYDSTQKSGNDTPLRKMGTDLQAIAGSGWTSGQPGEVLYNAAGATDDWVYDDLGVASFVWEIGPSSSSCSGFFPTYSCQAGTFWPKVKPMLTYAAGKAASPYATTTPPPTGCDKRTNDADVSIPDNGAAVTSTITITDCTGNASTTSQVEVHIKHTYRGDLVLDLVAPDGSSYRLKSSGNDSGDNIDTTYTTNLSTELRNGDWKLKVQDVASQDIGNIDTWSLTI
ncbi:M14 family zinc carboxypeptidase [Umezawaea sp. Da 62-37]|uniref:M14 family zinc carboxypeptidase n=1 Tax=Umezawaea sp. Da 62-37 TaxID=3075927 RepID=UPI0028F6CCA8|nr:M14 family zinc carboxypeptidase [Umezawaea sp. Da 62-37]WNV90451.1 M14 family zinc carboxypeptidase [Umezawaea sp. Da 62-37]